jgi:SET domain-containing protein
MLTWSIVKLVNGEHRIGIYALKDLEAGAELWMNYGPKFFSKPMEEGQGPKNVDSV